jgi:hypothetical protein
MAASLLPAQSTAFLPPDFSQMFPDLIVAVVTGVVVGLVVLAAERALGRRREESAQMRVQQVAVDELFAPLRGAPAYNASSLVPMGSVFKAARRRLNAIPNLKPTVEVVGFHPLRLCCDAWETLRLQAEAVTSLTGPFTNMEDFNQHVHAYYSDEKATWESDRWTFGDPSLNAEDLSNAVRVYCLLRSAMETSRESFVQSVRDFRKDEEGLWDRPFVNQIGKFTYRGWPASQRERKLLRLLRETRIIQSKTMLVEVLSYRRKRWGSVDEDD